MKLPPLAVTLAPGAALFGDIDSVAGTPRAVPGRTSEPSKNVKNSTNTEYLRVNLTIHLAKRQIGPAKFLHDPRHAATIMGPERDQGGTGLRAPGATDRQHH